MVASSSYRCGRMTMKWVVCRLFVVLVLSLQGTLCSLAPGDAGSGADVCSTIRILNVVPYPDNRTFAGWDRGFELIPAAHLATKHINNATDILVGYELEVIDIPSEACGISTITEGLLEFYESLTGDKCIFGVVGLFCSTVTNAIAPISNHPNVGHVTVAASTSPSHRNSSSLPYLFHIISSSSVFSEVVIAMMNEFQWNQINVVHDSLGFYFQSTSDDFVDLLQSNANKSVISRIPVTPTQEAISDAFDIINNEEARIGFFSVTEGEAASLFCEAYKRSFLWPGYVYILHERSLSQILQTEVNCTQEQMKKALQGVFLIEYKLFDREKEEIVSGMTYKQFYDEYLIELRKFAQERNVTLQEDNIYANSMYDQVWSFALAANRSLNAINFFNDSMKKDNIREAIRIRDILTENLKNVEFVGASGNIRYEDRREVLTLTDIYQINDGEQELVGFYDNNRKMINFLKNFNREAVPGDTFDVKYKLVPSWLGIIVFLCVIIILFWIIFVSIAVVYWRNRPEIKSASIYLSMIILLGCYSLCFATLLQTIQVSFVIDTFAFNFICNLELWFFINGINVIFMTLFMRLFRIYHVFRSYHSTGKYWSDKYLVLYIVLSCSVVVLLLTIWSIVDPLHRIEVRTYIPLAIPPHYLVHHYCTSDFVGIWKSLSFALIALVLLFVVFLATQTRHIKRKHFKDTKKVNMFIFTMCGVYAVFIPMWLILFAVGIETGAYVCKCIAQSTGAALCVVFLFIPKVVPNACTNIKSLSTTKDSSTNTTVPVRLNMYATIKKT